MVRMFALIKSQKNSKSGHVRPKSRSLGKILKKPCVHSTGLIFGPMLMKLRMFALMKSRTISKMGYVGVKKLGY